MKKIIAGVIILGLGVAAYLLRNNLPTTGTTTGASARPTTAEAIQTNINFSVNAAGEIGPAEFREGDARGFAEGARLWNPEFRGLPALPEPKENDAP